MLHGIDVSNHQGDNAINLNAVLPYYDFCIVKATGGTHFVDWYCDGFIEKCKAQNKLFGFYHFINDGIYSSAIEEASFFYENCKNYFKQGIPVVDWEVDVPASWVNDFVNYIYDKTGVWCWIYGNTWRFSEDVEQNCARWVAAYPSWIINPSPDFDPGECPDCNGLVAAWQYASDGRCPTYHGNLDVNVFYGDEIAWMKYALGDNYDNNENDETSQQYNDHKIVFDNDEVHLEITLKK